MSIATKLCKIQLTVHRVVLVCLPSACSAGRVVGLSKRKLDGPMKEYESAFYLVKIFLFGNVAALQTTFKKSRDSLVTVVSQLYRST